MMYFRFLYSSRENRTIPVLAAFRGVGLGCTEKTRLPLNSCNITWGYVARLAWGGVGGYLHLFFLVKSALSGSENLN